MVGRRRTQPTDQRAVVASATRIPLANPKAAKAAAQKAQEWQADAWAYYDAVPEVKFAVNWKRNLVGKVRLYVATLIEGSDAPVPVDAEGSGIPPEIAASAIAELARLQPATGGQATIQTEFAANMDVAGECYLVGQAARFDPNDPLVEILPERWDVKSVDEVRVDGSGRYKIVGSDGKTVTMLDPEQDTAIRLWRQHPRYSNLPESNLRAVLTDCRVLQTLTETLLAEANSRRNAGLLVVPNGVTWSRLGQPESPTSADEEDDPFLEALADALTAPIADPSNGASVIPLLLRAEAEAAKEIRRVDLGRATDASTDARITQRVERVARGLDVPVEVVMGHQSTTYANAAQISEDKFTDHVDPMCVLMVDAFSTGFLRPNLLESFPTAGDVISRIFVWYDPTALIGSPDQKETVLEAWDRFLLSNAAARDVLGYSDDQAPELDELLQRVAFAKGILTADLTGALLAAAGITLDVPEGGAAIPSPTDGASPPASPEQQARIIAALLQASGAGPPLRMIAGGGDRPRSPQR